MNDDTPPTPDPGEQTADRAALLALARDAIAHFLAAGEWRTARPAAPWLLTPAAVFVTLRPRADVADPGALRGCIGRTEADRPLYLAVQDAAVKAATVDPRFDPVTPDELPELSIEISILSPLRPLAGLDEIRIGRDGLLIVGEGHRGLLLPEVPLEYGWDATAFARALCRKAGLPEDAWRGPAQLYAFTTETITEPS